LETDPAARRLAYRDNLSSRFSFELDPAQVMADIEAGFDFEAIDVSLPDLGELLGKAAGELLAGNNAGADTEPQIDRAEELRVKWGVETGQLWQLGEHRIICGDCTDPAVVARVMGGERFGLCVTSPPYTDQREYKIGKFDWLTLANGFADGAFAVAGDNSNILVNLGLSHKEGKVDRYWDDWITHCEQKYPLYGWYVWDKGNGTQGEHNGRLAPSFEFVFHFRIGKVTANKWVEKAESSFIRNKYGHKFVQRGKDGKIRAPTSPHLFNQNTKIPDSVIRINKDKVGCNGHPAIFPVQFSEFFIKTWSQSNNIVYEPFSGSGTTIIACENLGRRCRAVEIDPGYVAVAIERWQQHTGQTPVKVTNG
jgi:DNA modification methylase